VHLGHLAYVARRIVEREGGQLVDDRADDPGDDQQRDLEDGEADAGQQPPGPPAEPGGQAQPRRRAAPIEGEGGDAGPLSGWRACWLASLR